MTATYRAAYWIDADGQNDIVLTSPEHSHLGDDELIAEAHAEAERVGLEVGGGRIEIGEYAAR